jgi:hypothetical protein
MKHILFLFICSLLSAGHGFAQKKDSLEAMIRTFIANEIKTASQEDAVKIKQTLNKIDFSRIETVSVPQTAAARGDNHRLIYLPIKNIHVNRFINNVKVPGTIASLRATTKVTFNAVDNRVYTGSIVEIATPLHSVEYLETRFGELVSDTDKEFTGQKSYNTLSHKLLIKAEYFKGVAVSSAIVKCKPAATPEINPPHKKLMTGCIDCFLVTTYYDMDSKFVSERTDFLYAIHGSK